MLLILVKYAVTAAVVVAVSEVAKRSDRWGAIVAALPMVTVLVMIWMRVERQPTEKIANHAYYTFWYVLRTLPMFLLMPWMMNRGYGFGWSLAAGCGLTAVCFVATAWALRPMGVDLLP